MAESILTEERSALLQTTTESLVANAFEGESCRGYGANVYPSRNRIIDATVKLTEVLFPEYYCAETAHAESIRFHVGHLLAQVSAELVGQVERALTYRDESLAGEETSEEAEQIIASLVEALPHIRQELLQDAHFALERDPAVKLLDEVMLCYPGFRSLLFHRISHFLHAHDVPLVPRIISEHAHSQTGIDIHPGAHIASPVFMDHGTGIVIGETAIIGRRVTIYQGVTLGAKSFPRDEAGRVVKGFDRHPVVEDDVVIYSGATVLGRITIGSQAVIGGNVWVTRDVSPGSRLLQSPGRTQSFNAGGGI